ncbi:hypothetical protein TELCIR_19628, partial [Teladorsagia circumcincta]
MFSSSATKVFGMEAQKLGELKDADKDAYDKVLTDICFKYFNWRINAKPNTYNCDLVLMENGEVDTSTVIPLIDGGTEGFKGNARVIYPKLSACIDCTLDLFPPQ